MPQLPIAKVFDGIDTAGRPVFRTDHERIADPEEVGRLARYLAGSPLVVRVHGMDLDVVDPSRRGVVPLHYRTDGTWIWSEASLYYLRTHALAPDPELRAHIAANGYRVPDVDRATRAMAGEQLLGSG